MTFTEQDFSDAKPFTESDFAESASKQPFTEDDFAPVTQSQSPLWLSLTSGQDLSRQPFAETIGPAPERNLGDRVEDFLSRRVGPMVGYNTDAEAAGDQPGVIGKFIHSTAIPPVGLATFTQENGKTTIPKAQFTPGTQNESGKPGLSVSPPQAWIIEAMPEGLAKNVSAGTYNAVANLANFFLSPQGAAMGIPGVAGGLSEVGKAAQSARVAGETRKAAALEGSMRALSAKFAWDMALAAPEQLMAGSDAYSRGDYKGAVENWLGGIGSTAFSGLAGSHAISSVPKALKSTESKPQSASAAGLPSNHQQVPAATPGGAASSPLATLGDAIGNQLDRVKVVVEPKPTELEYAGGEMPKTWYPPEVNWADFKPVEQKESTESKPETPQGAAASNVGEVKAAEAKPDEWQRPKPMLPKERRNLERRAQENIESGDQVARGKLEKRLERVKKNHQDVRRELEEAETTGDKLRAEIELVELENELRKLAGEPEVEVNRPITESDQQKARDYHARRIAEIEGKLKAGEQITDDDRQIWRIVKGNEEGLPSKTPPSATKPSGQQEQSSQSKEQGEEPAAAVKQAPLVEEQPAAEPTISTEVKPPELMTPEEFRATKSVGYVRPPGYHKAIVEKAIEDRSPVSVAAVGEYHESVYGAGGIKLPEGYVREGDRYVFKPQAEPRPSAPKAIPAASTPEPAAGRAETPKTAESPASAAAKVQEHVAEVANTEGKRPAQPKIRTLASEFKELVLKIAPQKNWGSLGTIEKAIRPPTVGERERKANTQIGPARVAQNEEGKAVKYVMRQAAKELGLDPDRITHDLKYRAANIEKIRKLVKQTDAFETATEYDIGKLDVYTSDLSVGDVLDVDGEKVKVSEVGKDYIVLEDGRRFGKQTRSTGETLYVEGYEPKAEAPLEIQGVKFEVDDSSWYGKSQTGKLGIVTFASPVPREIHSALFDVSKDRKYVPSAIGQSLGVGKQSGNLGSYAISYAWTPERESGMRKLVSDTIEKSTPKLRPGENQGDFIGGDVFNLSGEKGVDIERLQREKTAKEETDSANKKFQDESHTDLFDNEQSTPTKSSDINTGALGESDIGGGIEPGAKVRVGSNPTLHTVVEKLAQSEVERENGEQAVRIRNDKTGEESTVDAGSLSPVKERTPEERAAAKPKKDLDAELRKRKLDPSVFPDDASKREALKRAKAKAEDWTSATAETKENPPSEMYSGVPMPRFNDTKMSQLDRATTARSAKLQKSFSESRRAQNEINKTASEPRQNAIAVWREAGGDIDTLKDWESKAKGAVFKRAAKDAQSLTQKEIELGNKVIDTLDIMEARGNKFEVLGSHRDNYIPHVWDVSSGVRGFGAGVLKQRFKFAKARTLNTFFDGDQAGFKPKTLAIGKLIPAYIHEMNRVIADRQFVRDLASKTASDGRPLVIPKGYSKEIGEVGDETHLVFPRGAIEAKDAAGNAIDQSDYKTMEGQPALSKWRWIGKDSEGKPIMLQSDLALHPDAYRRLTSMLGKSAIREWYRDPVPGTGQIPRAVVRALDTAQSTMKREMFGLLAPFHQVQEGTHAVGHAVNPFFGLEKIDFRNPKQMDAAEHGLMLLPDTQSGSHYMEGVGTKSSFIPQMTRRFGGKAGRAVADVIDGYQDYLFHQYIPALKFKTYEAMLGRNMKLYADELKSGEMTEADVKLTTAQQTNAAYGHLNYALLDRNPTIQHLIQMAALAPDFLEARGRFVGQGFKGLTSKVGHEQFKAVALLAAIQAGSAFVISNLLGDDYDPKHPFEVIHKGRRYTLRSVPEDIYALAKDTRQFVSGRINPMLQTGIQLVTGLNYRGEKTEAIDTLGEMLAKYIPITARSIPGIRNLTETSRNNPVTPLEQLAGSLGLRISRYSPISETYKMAGDWMDKQKLNREKGSYPVSHYQKLRYALEDADMERAQKEYDALKTTMSSGKINSGFRESLFHPFTGNRVKDEAFKKSLSPSDLSMFNLAIMKRQEIQQRFNSLNK